MQTKKSLSEIICNSDKPILLIDIINSFITDSDFTLDQTKNLDHWENWNKQFDSVLPHPVVVSENNFKLNMFNGLQDHQYNIEKFMEYLKCSKNQKDITQEKALEIINDVSIPAPWNKVKETEESQKKESCLIKKPLFTIDWCFTAEHFSKLSEDNNVIFVYNNDGVLMEKSLWILLIILHTFPGSNLMVLDSKHDLLLNNESLTKLRNQSTKIVSANLDFWIENGLKMFGLENKNEFIFDFKRNFYFHGNMFFDGHTRKELAKNVDKYQILCEIGNLAQLHSKIRLMDWVYRDPEAVQNKLSKLIKVGWNMPLRKLQWSITEKEFIIDNFEDENHPFFFVFYDSLQDRLSRCHEFNAVFHKYCSYKLEDEEMVCFDKYWRPRGISGDNSVFFIDDHTHLDLTYSRDIFVNKFSSLLKDFNEDLQKKSEVLQNVKFQVPKSLAITPENYSKIDSIAKKNDVHYPIQLKSECGNFHDVYIVNTPDVLQEVTKQMHRENFNLQVQELVPHNSLIYKVYGFCGKTLVDKRYSLPGIETLKAFGDYRAFSKKNPMPEASQETIDYIKKAECPDSLFEFLCQEVSKKYGFYCFGIDVLLNEDVSNGKTYSIIDFNAMPGYGKNKGLKKSLQSLIVKHK